ncbi:TIGR00180 family glycosyltransferase [Alphaproteobacteria bacterium]|nr:TIGR00180 family glycosyltransferase [Alphaproteobacteria bacterium]MDC1121578.1 TIGR00180 family glycosyltransferase [Alphaproteobacteria bacterium]
MSLSNLLTIVINTKNRPRLLHASLKYMALSGSTAKVIITDASAGEVWKINDESISQLMSEGQCVHINPTDGRQFPSILEGLSHVKTPYTIVCGDDDFFMVDGLNSCVEFLEKNPSFSACIGKVMQFQGTWVDSSQEWKFSGFRDLTPSQIVEEKICERLCKYIDNIAVSSYAVHRSHVIQCAYNGAKDYDFYDDSSLPELALNSYTLMAGSLGVVDTFFHFWFSPKDKRSGMETTLYSGNNKLNWFDKLFSDQYEKNVNAFLSFLTKNPIVKTQDDLESITYIVKCVWGKTYFNVAQRRIDEAIDAYSKPRLFKKFVLRAASFIARQNIKTFTVNTMWFFRRGIRFGVVEFPLHSCSSEFRKFKKLISESMVDASLRPKNTKCRY